MLDVMNRTLKAIAGTMMNRAAEAGVRRKVIQGWVGALLVLLLNVAPAQALGMNKLEHNPWQVIPVPSEESLLDISFAADPNHGWLVGTKSALMETKDGGATWVERKLDLGEQKYRLSAVSFVGNEGWVAGQPALMLHTDDGGDSWEQIPLSDRLPGSPEYLYALGENSADMITDVGAIYRTTDGGRNWKAMVNDAFGVVRSLHRSDDGQYVAVSSRGNFFSIWRPGSTEWVPYQRNSSRRLQNMGFGPGGQLWLLARGGTLQFTNSAEPTDWQKAQAPGSNNSWGLLDMGFRTDTEIWASGGGGTVYVSPDGGKSWLEDRDLSDVPANLYKIKFLDENSGYILGQRGTLLKYQG
jgi:photosystem II stability/assembly factor-like uncharacterized protein